MYIHRAISTPYLCVFVVMCVYMFPGICKRVCGGMNICRCACGVCVCKCV